jgi:hypothetical protein
MGIQDQSFKKRGPDAQRGDAETFIQTGIETPPEFDKLNLRFSRGFKPLDTHAIRRGS